MKAMRMRYIFPILMSIFLIFGLELIFSPDTLPPYYCCNSTSSTFAGYEVIHSLKWFDDVALSGFIFSFDNCTGNFVNDTWVSFLTISKFNQSASINISGRASTTDQSLINSYLNVNGDGLTWDIIETEPQPLSPITFTTQQVESLSSAPLGPDKIVLAWCDEISKSINFKIYSTTGKVLVDTVTVDSSPGVTNACDYNSVSVAALNSTHFVIAWFDAAEQDTTFAVYDYLGNLKLGPIDEDTAVGTNSWGVSVSAFNSTHIVIGYYDYAEQDATFSTWNLVTQTRVVGPIDVDAGVSTDSYNVFVAALDSNTFAFFYYDAGTTDDATFAIYTITRTAVKAATDEDAAIGDSYSLSLTVLNSSYFVVAYYDAADRDITFSIYNRAGTRVVGPIDEDGEVGASGAFVSVAALNSTHFVIAYYDAADGQHTFSIYNWNTRVVGPIDVSNVASGLKWVSVTSYQAGINLGICNQNWVFAEVDATNNARFFTFTPSGTIWNGYCTPTYNLEVEHNFSVSYSGVLKSASLMINFSSSVDDVYNLTLYDFSSSTWDSSTCTNISAYSNQYVVGWCNFTNPKYISPDGKVRFRIFTTPDSDQATLKEEYVQLYLEYYPNESWSSVTKLINSTVGCTIRWRVYANDTSNNWNVSEIFYYKTTTPAYLEVNLITPLPNIITNIKQYSTFWVNASVTCRNGNCGDVTGTIRYNSTSSEPDTPIPSTPSTPFYLINYPSSQSCGTLNRDQTCTLSWLVNVTGDPNTVWKVGVLFSSSYNIQNHTSNATISIFFCTIDFTVAFSNIEFGNVWPSTKGNPAIGNDFNLYNISVNQGSCYLNISISATDLTNSTFNSIIPVNNLKFSTSSNDYSKSYSLSNNFIQIAQNVAPLANITLWFWLDVPPIYAGYYVGYVYIKGESLEV